MHQNYFPLPMIILWELRSNCYLIVVWQLTITTGLLHSIHSNASQSLILVAMQFELRAQRPIAVIYYLLRLLAANCLSASDSTEKWMSQAAGARWSLIWIPRDHLVD